MKIKMKDRIPHKEVTMQSGGSRYDNYGYSTYFTCPICGQACWQSMNFLGSKTMRCNGLGVRKIKMGYYENKY